MLKWGWDTKKIELMNLDRFGCIEYAYRVFPQKHMLTCKFSKLEMQCPLMSHEMNVIALNITFGR